MSVSFLSVSVMPRSLDLFVGDDVTLICKGQSGLTKWFVNGKEQSDQNSSVLLTAVTTKNNGEYECERGGSRSSPYTLTVLGMNMTLNVHSRSSVPAAVSHDLLSLSQSWRLTLSSFHL